jgi:hypothetical protein
MPGRGSGRRLSNACVMKKDPAGKARAKPGPGIQAADALVEAR